MKIEAKKVVGYLSLLHVSLFHLERASIFHCFPPTVGSVFVFEFCLGSSLFIHAGFLVVFA